MEFDTLFDLWDSARKAECYEDADRQVQAARRYTSTADVAGWDWFAKALLDPNRKWFVAEIFVSFPVPKRLFPLMVLAGVLEKDPSNNRYFIEPCVESYGSQEVLSELLRFLRSDSNEEVAGAASALYCVTPSPNQNLYEKLRNIIQEQMLQVFISNENLDVRRRIIPMLELKAKRYPSELHLLVEEAIRIARAHSDEYIRHRVEVQLGKGGPFQAIPNTQAQQPKRKIFRNFFRLNE